MSADKLMFANMMSAIIRRHVKIWARFRVRLFCDYWVLKRFCMVFAFVFWVEATAKVRIIGLVFSFRLFIVPLIVQYIIISLLRPEQC